MRNMIKLPKKNTTTTSTFKLGKGFGSENIIGDIKSNPQQQQQQKKRQRKRFILRIMTMLVLCLGILVMIWNFRHLQNVLSSNTISTTTTMTTTSTTTKMTGIDTNDNDSNNQKKNELAELFKLYNIKTSSTKYQNQKNKKDMSSHKLGGLNCDQWGGPSPEIAQEMIYWRDIPSDATNAKFQSPYANYGPTPKYLTFEPDEGGWNNIRMSMETATVLALVMGRILVLPPTQPIYLLWNDPKNKNNRFTFHDFFHFDSIELEHSNMTSTTTTSSSPTTISSSFPIVKVITMKEFLEQAIDPTNTNLTLIDKNTGKVTRPPNNGRTDWDDHGFSSKSFLGALNRQRKFWLWLRNATAAPIWNFQDCIVGISKQSGMVGEQRMKEYEQRVVPTMSNIKPRHYVDNPTPVDGTTEMRMKEMLGERRQVCIYNEELQNAQVLHFMGDNDSGARLLTHFYSFLFMEDWHDDLWVKRFVRDHLRYIDEIQCAAARIVFALRQKSIEHGNSNGIFDTFHIRRGDFQYKATRIDAIEIYNNVMDVLEENATIYIATDEKNISFFDPLKEHYHVYFLHDFMDLIPNLNKNYYGMLDQRIASRGRTFIGTFYSTFTGYINRMRGYHAEKDRLSGHELGRINSYFYAPKSSKYDMDHYHSIKKPYWAREFPIGWRDIDKDVDPSQFVD